jgi:hypothetical protein
VKKLLAAIALLVGASALAPPANASAAMGSSGLRAAAARAGLIMPDVGAGGRSQVLPRGYVLAQYGDDDDGPRGGGGGGGGGHHGGGCPGCAGAAINLGIGIITNIMRQQQQMKQQQQYQQQQQQQRNYNAKRQQDINNQRAKERELDRKRETERLRKEELEQERIDEAKKKAIEEYRARNQPVPGPTPQPYYPPTPVPTADTDQYHDTVQNNVINIVFPPDNCPDNFQELRVGPTALYARRTDFPADRNICSGTTAKGCYLRVMNAPATCGGSQPVCVAYCVTPPPTPPIKQVELPKPTPVPYPVPACNGPNCGPVLNPTCVGGNCPPVPYPVPVCNGPNCGPVLNPTCVGGNCPPVPPVIQPRPTTEAVITIKSHDAYEPKPIPTKYAELTVKSHESYEPKPIPTKSAELTVKSHEYVEPKPVPTKSAELTVKSHEYVEPKPVPTKTAERTVKSHEYVEPKPVPTKTAERTVKSHDDVEQEYEHPKKPVRTVKSHDDVATLTPDSDRPKDKTNNHEGELDEVRIYDPVKCPNFNACKDLIEADDKKDQEAKKKREDEKKKREDEEAFDRKVDSKNCTGNGGLSNASLRNNTDYRGLMQCITNACKPMEASDPSFDHLVIAKVRDAATGLMAAIPDYGGALSGVVKFLWEDPTPDAVFEQMKDYVNKLVPQMISDERKRVLSSLINGMRADLGSYRDDTEPLSKGGDLITIEGILRAAKEQFDDPDHPEELLGYFIAFGTLHLAVMREQYLHTKELYCPPDKDYNNSQTCAGQHQAYLKKLNKGVADYGASAQKVRDNVLAWRLNKLHVNTDHDTKVQSSEGGGGDGPPIINVEKIYKATAADDFCDTSLWHPATHEHAEFDDGPDDTKNAQADVDARKAAVTKAFGDNLDLILAPVAHWASSTELAAPVTEPGRQAAK